MIWETRFYSRLNERGNPHRVQPKQVHFIANTNEAQILNGTPYGNAGRNILRDYKTNLANFEVAKTVNWGERARIIWHMSMTNAFNHPNYASIDPFLEDAGLVGPRPLVSLIRPCRMAETGLSVSE